jgi:hypothetical protein
MARLVPIVNERDPSTAWLIRRQTCADPVVQCLRASAVPTTLDVLDDCLDFLTD